MNSRCERCNGNLMWDKSVSPPEIACLQCGFRKDPTLEEVFYIIGSGFGGGIYKNYVTGIANGVVNFVEGSRDELKGSYKQPRDRVRHRTTLT